MKQLALHILALTLSACAAGMQDYSPQDNGFYETPQAEFDVLKSRLIRTAAGLMRANAPLCPSTRMITTPSERFAICTNKVAIEDSAILNAQTNGETIVITSAMIARFDDNELAFLIAHELAHSVEGDYVETKSRPGLELVADRTGVFLMARAGYKTAAALSALKALGIPDLPRTDTHPSGANRMTNLRSSIKEVTALQSANSPLVP